MKVWPCPARVLNRLREAEGGIVTREELIDAIWGDDPGGGSLMSRGALLVHIHRLRKLGYPIENVIGRGYRFVPEFKEMADMTDAKETGPRVLKRERRKSAADYLPELEKIRIARTIDSLKAQVADKCMAIANIEGALAARDHEIKLLQSVVAELNQQREAAWAKPDNMVVDPAHPPIHEGPLKAEAPAA